MCTRITPLNTNFSANIEWFTLARAAMHNLRQKPNGCQSKINLQVLGKQSFSPIFLDDQKHIGHYHRQPNVTPANFTPKTARFSQKPTPNVGVYYRGWSIVWFPVPIFNYPGLFDAKNTRFSTGILKINDHYNILHYLKTSTSNATARRRPVMLVSFCQISKAIAMMSLHKKNWIFKLV